ncbi:MAG: ATP-binding protein [Erysipelotrichaceae bacterium]|nr:ATP-binding protein [Erysipelotrichaceae bacterium]
MLIQFSFKNFRSFRDDAILDLSATKMTEYKSHIITVGLEKLLPTAAIFGANAGGKSNVYLAFRYMCTYVCSSFAFGGDSLINDEKSQFPKPTPFLFDNNSKDAESVFEVYFIGDEQDKFKTYNYGFSVDVNGVKEEWLNTKAKSSRGEFKSVFYRNRDEDILELCRLPKNCHDNIETALEKEVLIVSLGAKLKIDELKCVRDWFMKHEVVNYGNPVENLVLSRFIPKGFADDPAVRAQVVDFISTFDESIVGFQVNKYKDDEGRRQMNINALHKINGSDELVSIPLREESAGTLKMFSLYPRLMKIMETGGVFFIDELNSRLHPLLVRNFILCFLNPEMNKSHAQLIFTSHDTWALENDLLRRDEIWFVEKEDTGASQLYSLADFNDANGIKIRKDENYEKNYMLGKYGAIPALKPMINKKEN